MYYAIVDRFRLHQIRFKSMSACQPVSINWLDPSHHRGGRVVSDSDRATSLQFHHDLLCDQCTIHITGAPMSSSTWSCSL